MPWPDEVLASIAAGRSAHRGVVRDLYAEERRQFGCRYNEGRPELKVSLTLNRTEFGRAELNTEVAEDDIPALARNILDEGSQADAGMLKGPPLGKLGKVRLGKAIDLLRWLSGADSDCRRATASVVRACAAFGSPYAQTISKSLLAYNHYQQAGPWTS